MPLSDQLTANPNAFRQFLEGVERFQAYLTNNVGDELLHARNALNLALKEDPGFEAALFYKALVLTHQRLTDEAIDILERLKASEVPFLAEVCYHLAYAYAKKYKWEALIKAEESLEESRRLAETEKRLDLLLLIRPSKTFIYAIWGGREMGHGSDFEERKKKYLPLAIKTGMEVLADPDLNGLDPKLNIAVRVEAHNGLGIAYVRMGENSTLFGEEKESYWTRAEQHFKSSLSLQSRNVRVLQNLGWLRELQGISFYKQGMQDASKQSFHEARTWIEESVRLNPFDQYPHMRLCELSIFSEDWDSAQQHYQAALGQPGEVRREKFERLREAIEKRDRSLLLAA
jgi:tetratricopeptide (TPR) repeat protein